MIKFQINNRRYLGSKAKLVNFIQAVVHDNCENIHTIADIFAGTGVVGYSFNKDCSIIINDYLESNKIVYDTFFSDMKVNIKKIENIIHKYNNIDIDEENYYSINFADTYLSKENMKKVGYIRDHIDELYNNKEINDREKSILICSLIYAIDRIANTVGHYDAYRKNGNLDKVLYLQMPDLSMDIYNQNNEIYKEDSNELVKRIKADLVYIDPPYNSRQYCDAYHFLENIVLNKKPEVYGAAKKMGRAHLKSKYCTSKAPSEFHDLIEHIDSRYILVSYNNTGEKRDARSNAKISDTQILEILTNKGEVKIFEQDHSLFNSGKTKYEDDKERLFLCSVNHYERG